MDIEFRHGPKDGDRKFLPLGKMPETMIICCDGGADWLYRKTERKAQDGTQIYQCLGQVKELSATA